MLVGDVVGDLPTVNYVVLMVTMPMFSLNFQVLLLKLLHLVSILQMLFVLNALLLLHTRIGMLIPGLLTI